MFRLEFFSVLIIFGIAVTLTSCGTPTVSSDEGEEVSSSSNGDEYEVASSSSDKGNISSSSRKVETGKTWDGSTAKSFAEGMGTKPAPYIIETAEQLAYLSYLTNLENSQTKSVYYKLASDILLNEGKIINEKGEFIGDTAKLYKWTPIGVNSSFLGYFDGDGHSIEGLFISTTNNAYGLFGYNGGKISNLTIKNSYIKAKNNVAAFAGINYGEIENVVNEATVIGEDAVGGIAGGIQSLSKYDSKSIFEKSIISKSINSGIVSGSSKVGGVCGFGRSGVIESSENNSYVNGRKDYTGGIVGINENQAVALQNLNNSGNINGVNYVSGISGGGTTTISWLSSYARSISNASNSGEISGSKYVAGIVAYAYGLVGNKLSNTGKIIGTEGVAGIFGYAEKDTLENAYNLGEVQAENIAGGIAGNATESIFAYVYNAGPLACDKDCGSIFANVKNTTLNTVYFLDKSFETGVASNDGGGAVTAKTAEEMKSEEFAKNLNDCFAYQKDGYPVFAE